MNSDTTDPIHDKMLSSLVSDIKASAVTQDQNFERNIVAEINTLSEKISNIESQLSNIEFQLRKLVEK